MDFLERMANVAAVAFGFIIVGLIGLAVLAVVVALAYAAFALGDWFARGALMAVSIALPLSWWVTDGGRNV